MRRKIFFHFSLHVAPGIARKGTNNDSVFKEEPGRLGSPLLSFLVLHLPGEGPAFRFPLREARERIAWGMLPELPADDLCRAAAKWPGGRMLAALDELGLGNVCLLDKRVSTRRGGSVRESATIMRTQPAISSLPQNPRQSPFRLQFSVWTEGLAGGAGGADHPPWERGCAEV